MNDIEEWRQVPGYEGLYSVSDRGRVRRDAPGRGARPGKILRPVRRRSGHLAVKLCHNGTERRIFVHRLVMLAFKGDCPEGLEVAHGNGDPTDNGLDNLRYASRSENLLDAHRYGGRTPSQNLSIEQVAEIRMRLAAGEMQAKIARAYRVSRQTITDIKYGYTWRHRLDQERFAALPGGEAGPAEGKP